MPHSPSTGYDRTVSLSATEVTADEIDWSTFESAPRPEYRTKEERRNLTLAELTEVHSTKASLEEREFELIKSAKSDGATWKEIGDAIMTSRQTAHRAYAHLVE